MKKEAPEEKIDAAGKTGEKEDPKLAGNTEAKKSDDNQPKIWLFDKSVPIIIHSIRLN